MRKLFYGFGIILLLLGIVLVGSRLMKSPSSEFASTKITVVTTFYPVAAFTKGVGGDNVTVTTLIPPGTEPHDFEPTPQEIAHLSESKLFIYNGAGLERWMDKVIPVLQAKNIRTLNVSEKIDLIRDEKNLPNPHFWIDPVSAQREIDEIRDALKQVDPVHESDYDSNAEQYSMKLSALDGRISGELASCKSRTVITAHDAFGYYAKRYNLEIVPIAGLSPDEEPSPARLAEIADFARAHSVKYIFFESLVSPRLSDTIAQEVGARTLVFNPLEGLTKEELKAGKDYFSVQEENLNNLKIALEC